MALFDFKLQYFADGTLNFDTKVDTDGLNEGTEEAGSKFSKLGGIFETGLGVLTGNLMTGALDKIKELGASCIDAGANYEQLVGGVETLFANSFSSVEEFADGVGLSVEEVADDFEANENAIETVLANANKAYKTAGLSVNDYMETATSFAASLNQSTSGVGESADVADMAIADMADNANKMGTSMEAIQNAYNGFSKSNFTMLDNLKLGYGGTKTEMERLLADASELSGMDYSIDSLSDIMNAIHVIQEDMGITGTTAKEAASTYSGSLMMLQSAWENVLTAISSGEGMEGAIAGLAEGLVAYGSNAVRILGTIVEQVPVFISTAVQTLITMLSENMPAIAAAGQSILENFKTAFTQGIPDLLAKGSEILQGIIDGITQNLPAIQEKASQILSDILTTITAGLPSILEQGVQIVTQLANGFLSNLPTFILAVGDMISQFVGFLLENAPTIIQNGIQMLQNLVDGIIQNLPAIVSAVVKVVMQFISTLVTHLPQILAKGIEIVIQLVSGIIQAIPKIIAAMPKVIAGVTDALRDFDWIGTGRKIIDGIVQGVKSVASALKDAIVNIAKSAFQGVKDFFGIHSPSKLMEDKIGKFLPLGIAEGIKDTTDDAVSAMKETAGEIANAANIDSGLIGGAVNTVKASSNIGTGIAERSATINVPLYIDGREFARAEAPYLNKQLAWEA